MDGQTSLWHQLGGSPSVRPRVDGLHVAGMGVTRQKKWDLRFLALAKEVASWSKDPSTQVGAALVKSGKVMGLGYNGLPRKVADTDERLHNRELKYPMTVHAEANAILQAGHDAKGSTLYVYPAFPMPPCCPGCAGLAIQAGVVGAVGFLAAEDNPRALRWGEGIQLSREMWSDAKLFCRAYIEDS